MASWVEHCHVEHRMRFPGPPIVAGGKRNDRGFERRAFQGSEARGSRARSRHRLGLDLALARPWGLAKRRGSARLGRR
jgi:hypothetical protein